MTTLRRTSFAKFAVGAGSALVALFLAEGALSLVFGTSLREALGRGRRDGATAVRVPTDEERWAARRAGGPYAVAVDPTVGFHLPPQQTVEVHSVAVQSDRLGLRARPGGEGPADALRIVVLGDSVAFGYGVGDGETLAVRLEEILTQVRGASARPVVCRTVGLPGWNCINAFQFLRDHYDELRCDLVLYLPVANDLEDTFGVTEGGLRCERPDPLSDEPLLSIHDNATYFAFAKASRPGLDPDRERIGPTALLAGLSETSVNRIDRMARTILDGARFLERNGSRLILLPHSQHRLYQLVAARLEELGSAPPVIPLLSDYRREDQLPDDAHPNPETITALAIWTAQDLFERGYVDAVEGLPIPDLPPRFEGRRARIPAAGALVPWRESYLEATRGKLRSRVSDETLEGMRQVFGGVAYGGLLEPRCRVLLPPGETLEVELAPLAERPDLYPLSVSVEVSGARLGAIELESGSGPRRKRFALPQPCRTAPFEVLLRSDHWCVVKVAGRSRTAVARFIEMGVSSL